MIDREHTRILLTDFNDDRYVNINTERLPSIIINLNQKIADIGVLYGSVRNDADNDIMLRNVSHTIRNIDLDDKKVYADILFLRNRYGNMIVNHFDSIKDVIFKPFCLVNRNGIIAITTWNITQNL